MASGKGRIDMKWFKRKAKSIVSKTVLATLAISLTALILVSVFMFMWFRKEMIKDYRQLTKTTMENVDSAFSRIIDDAKNVTAEWFSTAGGTVMRLDPDADFLDYMSFVNNVKSVMLGSSYMQSFGIINKNKEVSAVFSDQEVQNQMVWNLFWQNRLLIMEVKTNHLYGR